MANPYTAFPIKSFKSGINTYLQPWIRPEDAFDPLVNAYVNRGTINKRAGFSVFGNQLADEQPVMGIMRYLNEQNGDTTLVVASTENFYEYNEGLNEFDGLTAVDGVTSTFFIGTATGTVATDLRWSNVLPASVVITDGTDTLTFDAAGVQTSGASGIFDTGSTLTVVSGVATGDVSIVFSGSTPDVTLSVTLTLVTPTDISDGPLTGNITNFFNWTNWQASEQVSSYLYMTNNIDPLTLFDGTNLSRPILYTDSAHDQFITTAQDVKVYKQRLLLIRPTYSVDGVQNQTIAWSAIFNPTNFEQDISGNGGFLAAPTGDTIVSAEFIRDVLVVFFSASTWIFRFTGNAFEPFRWDQVNNSKNTNAPYGSVSYDQRTTSIGNTGLIACDGVNVQRYDIPIIDYYQTNFSENYYEQSFSQRYDNLNQTWTFYVSNSTPYPLVGGVAPGSDSAVVYNFIEDTWSTYKWPVPMTCLGLFNKTGTETWADLMQAWEDTDATWDSYAAQKDAIIMLGGDTTGNVYLMDDTNAVTDNGTSIIPDIVTTRWNPIIDVGQKTQFGYIDIYYLIASVDPTSPIDVTLNFYIDNSDNYQLQKTLTLDGPVNSEYAWKRIYINMIGEFIKMEIDPNVDSYMQFVGFILWARPAGRLTGP